MMFLWYGDYFALSVCLDLRGHCLTPVASPRSSWGVRSEYPLSILRNLTRPPPCFCVVCTPSPLEGWLGTVFRAKSNAYYFFTLAASPNRPWIPARESGKKAVFRGRKGRFLGSRGPRKRDFLALKRPWILKASNGRLMSLYTMKSVNWNFQWRKKER